VSKENYAMSVQDQTAGGMCDSSEDAGYDATPYWLRCNLRSSATRA
jgi:hypothetical protein